VAENTYGRTDTLPPIGSITPGSAEEASAVSLIYSRRQAIVNSLSLPLQLAKTCRKIAAWGEDIERPDESKTVVHKIRQAIETQVSSHLKEPVKVGIEPVETGEYAKWYWCGPPEAAMDAVAMGIPMDPVYIGGVSPMGQFFKPEPLPAQLVVMIKQASEQLPDIISPDYICKLDDQYVAKTIQKKFDSDWREAKGDKWLRSRVYANIIEGWQLPFYEFDSEKGHILNRNSIFQTYIAQECEDIDDAPEAGIDLYMDLDEAVARYPDQKDAITQGNVQTGTTLQVPGTGGQVPTQYTGQFNRPMVCKVVWWIRNQVVNVPMGEQEAVDGGHVNPVGTVGQGADALTNNQPPPAPPEQEGEMAAGLSDSGQAPQPTGVDASIAPAPSPYSLPDGTPVDPTHPQWPARPRLALRQISIINNAIVEDVVCPWPDIPIVHMRNTMVIGKPWGVGEPFYAKKLQDAYSTITDAAVRHTEYNANGSFEMHDGLKQAMQKEYGRAFVDPGRIIGVPANLWLDGKPLIRAVMPPPFPESSLQIRGMLGEDFNDISGRPDVLAGRSPSANDSGRKIEQLTMNASEPLNFKAQEIAFCVEKLATLMTYAILNYQDPAKIAEQLSMPLPLFMLVLERANKRPPNIAITISTGAGSVLERKRAMYVNWNQLVSPDDGLPLIDGKRTRNIIHGEADSSVRQSIQSRREAMTALPVQPQGEGKGEQQGGKPQNGQANGNGQQPSNGNGHGGRFGQ
jgi:hypothetical protein